MTCTSLHSEGRVDPLTGYTLCPQCRRFLDVCINERLEASATAETLRAERDRFRAALEKCGEAVGIDTGDPKYAGTDGPLSRRVTVAVQSVAAMLRTTLETIDALTEGKGHQGSPRLDRLRWLIERLERNAKENADQYTVEAKLKRDAQQARDKALGYVETHRLERNAARERLDSLARLVIKAEHNHADHWAHDCLQWLRRQSGYGAPSGAAPAPAGEESDRATLGRSLEAGEKAWAAGDDHLLAAATFAAVRVLTRMVVK